MFEVTAGKASGALAVEIALKNGRSKPTIKDRCHAAMITVSPLMLFGVTFMGLKFFPEIDKSLDLFMDDRVRLFYLKMTLFLIIVCGIFWSFYFVLKKMPLFLTAMIFVILAVAFSMLIIHGIIYV